MRRLVSGRAAKNGLSFHIARYDDRGDLLAALRAGDIDLAATSYAGEAQKFPAIAEFSPQAMYFAIAPQRPEWINRSIKVGETSLFLFLS